MSGKVLILGFVGLRPAVIPACLNPLTDWFKQQYDGVDLLLAATEGQTGSARFIEKLNPLLKTGGYGLIDSIVFDSRMASAAFEEQVLYRMFAHARDYATVILFLKGGLRYHDFHLFQSFKCPAREDQIRPYLTINSDSERVYVLNTSGFVRYEAELASLGLDSYLALVGHIQERIDKNKLVLREYGRRDGQEFLYIEEEKGFLSGIIDARGWKSKAQLKKIGDARSMPAHEKLRLVMAQARRFGMGEGRSCVGIITDEKAPESLTDRMTSFATVFRTIQPGERPKDIMSDLKKRMRDRRPGGQYEQGLHGNVPQSYLPSLHKSSAGSTLLMNVSPRPSHLSLQALYTHKPANLVLCYDENTADAVIAARRLSAIAVLMGCSVATVRTDHVGAGLKAKLDDLRATRFQGNWDIQLQPGTKEQGQALLGAGFVCNTDTLWMYTPRKTAVSFPDGSRTLTGNSPPLRDLAFYIGGDLFEPIQIDCAIVTEVIESIARNLFSHLCGLCHNARPAASHIPHYGHGRIEWTDSFGKKQRHQIPESFRELFDLDNAQRGTWFEAFTAVAVHLAGADEVFCNVKWKWPDQKPEDLSWRDEIDVIARFGSEYVSIECKADNIFKNRDKIRDELWQHTRVTLENLGTMVRPALALPWSVPEMTNAEFPLAEVLKRNELLGEKGCLMGANRLARPDNLSNWLFGVR
jgi:hypothetical protein